MELRRWGWKLGVRRILGDGDDRVLERKFEKRNTEIWGV